MTKGLPEELNSAACGEGGRRRTEKQMRQQDTARVAVRRPFAVRVGDGHSTWSTEVPRAEGCLVFEGFGAFPLMACSEQPS
jgi:hypothetical protein